jgi:selenocysteine lyase/cysteine desulfurase
LLANLFMHYAFDAWIGRTFPSVRLERYWDDMVVHCTSEWQALPTLISSGGELVAGGSRVFGGHECQRQAPACWPATLLRGGVPRVMTGPPRGSRAASADPGRSRVLDPGGPVTVHQSITPYPHDRSAGGPLLPVVGGDLRAPLADGSQVRYVNLDYAGSPPCLEAVAARVSEVLPYYASVHRGAGYTAQVSTELYEEARATVAGFVNARGEDVVVFCRNTTDALNLLAGCVPGNRDVVYLDVEHHANMLPWQRRPHRCLAAGATVEQTLSRLERNLTRQAAALVAVSGASNVTGDVLPLERVAAIAHLYGARVVVDAAQLAPHRRIDLARSGVDYLALSGHKLYAPFGAGALIGRRDWLDAAPAYLAGGGAVREVTTLHTQWVDAPRRHEAGTPNLLGAIALATACTTLAALPDDALHQHEHGLRDRLLHGLANLDEVRVLQLWPDSEDHVGLASFTVADRLPDQVAARLSEQHGIGIRTGRFCAHPLLTRLGAPAGALRASLGVGTQAEDIERLLDALHSRRRTPRDQPHQPGTDPATTTHHAARPG